MEKGSKGISNGLGVRIFLGLIFSALFLFSILIDVLAVFVDIVIDLVLTIIKHDSKDKVGEKTENKSKTALNAIIKFTAYCWYAIKDCIEGQEIGTNDKIEKDFSKCCNDEGQMDSTIEQKLTQLSLNINPDKPNQIDGIKKLLKQQANNVSKKKIFAIIYKAKTLDEIDAKIKENKFK